MNEINIGKEFSTDPSGRFYSDGDGSGEEFREEYLLPALSKLKPGQKLNIILDDGVDSYGSSFLTEGFAGVIKYGHMRPNDLLNILTFECHTNQDFEFYKERVISYIKNAKYNSEKYKPTKRRRI